MGNDKCNLTNYATSILIMCLVENVHGSSINVWTNFQPCVLLNFGVLGVLRVCTLKFLHHFAKNPCTKIDIEFHQLGLTLNAKNEHVVKVGMVFNVSLRFQNYANDVVIYAHCSWILTFDQSLFSFSCKCVMIYAIFVSTWQIVVFHFLGFAFLWMSFILIIGFIRVTRNVFVQNLKPLCCNILLYGTKIYCLAITPSPNIYLWQYTCHQYVLITLRSAVATLQTFAIYYLPSWALVKKKNRQVTYRTHKILATYSISYMSCEATLATSHTWEKKRRLVDSW